MHRQVGNLKIEEGIAKRGLLIRHLVLPNRIGGSKKVIEFVSDEVSKDSYFNVLFQYRPLYQANQYRELNRPPQLSEYLKVIKMAKEAGLHRGFQQES